MDKYMLRFIVLGQVCIVGLLALTATPADGVISFGVLSAFGMLAVIDTLGLAAAYFFRQDEFESPLDFLKAVW